MVTYEASINHNISHGAWDIPQKCTCSLILNSSGMHITFVATMSHNQFKRDVQTNIEEMTIAIRMHISQQDNHDTISLINQ